MLVGSFGGFPRNKLYIVPYFISISWYNVGKNKLEGVQRTERKEVEKVRLKEGQKVKKKMKNIFSSVYNVDVTVF